MDTHLSVTSARRELIAICITVPLTVLFSIMRLDVSELVIIFNRSATGRIKQVDVLSKVKVCINYRGTELKYLIVANIMQLKLSFDEHLDTKMLGKYQTLLGLVH